MKITANKQVAWDVGGKEMVGKVKQVMTDHVVVRTADAEYIVRKAVLRPVSAVRAK
jgi:hypothetical protein